MSKHILDNKTPCPKVGPYFEEHLRLIEGLHVRDADRARLAKELFDGTHVVEP